MPAPTSEQTIPAPSAVAPHPVAIPGVEAPTNGCNPWELYFESALWERLLLRLALRSPTLGRALASLIGGERAVDYPGLEARATYRTRRERLLLFAELHARAGSPNEVRELRHRFLVESPDEAFGLVSGLAKMRADLEADHRALEEADGKYQAGRRSPSSLAASAVQRIGLQMLAAYRLMRYARAARIPVLPKLLSRLIRHLYAADIHWDARLAPGTIIVHGIGLVVSHAARVGPGCVLFHHVTLGESIHPDTREIGAPTIERDVHVGAGATLLGPITVGAGTKIAAHVVLMHSVDPQSLVEMPQPTVRTRPRRPPAPHH